ncbi:MAG: magnesium transporter [Bacteroidetes bacterium]|nr:MAG: magnesium transporter [Bacteroidota bacterium]
MSFQLTDSVFEELRDAVENDTIASKQEQLALLHPADMAELLNRFEPDQAVLLYELLPDEPAAEALLLLDEEVREKILERLTPQEIAEQVIDNLDSDDAADVIAELPDHQQDQVLSHVEDSEQAGDIADLLNYDPDTAGGIMAKELISVNVNKNVWECVREIRKQAEEVETVYTIYVVDDDEKLMGLLSLKSILTKPLRTPIREVYNDKVVSVKVNMPKEEVASVMRKYDLVVVPVVDALGRLVGRITIDDVVDVMQEEAEKDMQMLSGISVNLEQKDRVWPLSRARIPWLLVGLAGGILGSRIIGTYESQIQLHPEMAFFIPLIGAMGGNVGVQSSAIVVQGLANNTIQPGNMFPKLIRELSVGLVNGLICSLIILAYNLITNDSMNLCITVSTALFSVIIFASFLGTFVPLTLNRMKLDPALATGPFVTTVNDIIGMTIYFLVGRLLYSA